MTAVCGQPLHTLSVSLPNCRHFAHIQIRNISFVKGEFTLNILPRYIAKLPLLPKIGLVFR